MSMPDVVYLPDGVTHAYSKPFDYPKAYYSRAAVERAAVQAVTKFVHIAMHEGRLTVAEKDAAVAAVDAAMRALEGK